MKSIFSKAFIKNAEQMSLTKDEINQKDRGYGSYGNDERPLDGMFKRASESAKQKELAQKLEEIKSGPIGEYLEDPYGKDDEVVIDNLENISNELNPTWGEYDTKAGELAFAFKNLVGEMVNGDVFYAGEGVNTCGIYVDYIANNVPETENIFDKIAHDYHNYCDAHINSYGDTNFVYNDAYNREMANIARLIITELNENPNMFTEPSDNLKDYDENFIRDNYLEYQYDSMEWCVDEFKEIDENQYNGDDIAYDIYSDFTMGSMNGDIDERDVEVDLDSGYVTISNLSWSDQNKMDYFMNREINALIEYYNEQGYFKNEDDE